MEAILKVFVSVSSFFAISTLLLPIVASLFARKKKAVFKSDLKLFEIYIYFTFVVQIYAVVLNYFFWVHNIFLFHLYLPIHTAVFTYFILKWLLGKNKNIIILVSLSIIISILGEFLTGELDSYPYFMSWFDTILLVGLSFLLSFNNDKKKIHLPKEYSFIHLGIYLYSIITLIGLFPSQIGYINFSLFLQSFAIVISNYYFAWSFICLFRSRG